MARYKSEFVTEVGTNPFVNKHFRIKVTEVTDTDKLRIEPKSGITLPEIKHWEYLPNVKVFTQSKGYKDTIDRLEPCAKILYLYIQSRIQKSEDYIEINVPYYMKCNNVGSINTYKKALLNLLDNNILSQMGKYKNVYWVNPSFMFAGNRVTKYPKHLDVIREINK